MYILSVYVVHPCSCTDIATARKNSNFILSERFLLDWQPANNSLCLCLVCVDVIEVQVKGMMVGVFANGPRDWGSIPGGVIPNTQKMVLAASLRNTQQNKVRIKGKVEQSRERVCALSYTLVL